MTATPVTRAAPHGSRVRSPEREARFGVVVASAEGLLLSANATFARLLGYPSLDALRGKSLPRALLRSEADWELWAAVAAGSSARDVRAEFVAADGRTVHVRGRIEGATRARGGAPAVRAILVDNAPEQHLEELAARAARMEGTLGLAAGISHDFNNLLTVLVGNLYLVSEGLRDQPALYEKVRKAREAAKRGAGLARQLMDVSRGGDAGAGASALDIGRVYESLAPLLSAALGSRITLKSEIAGDLPSVFVNRTEIESVITNLVINARDALAGRPAGKVVISARRRELRGTAESPRVKTGSYVELTVTDDGCGIPPEFVSRVFEPFFSTKERGHGNGLGLPMVRWFAERARGSVSLRSQPGRGTTVEVLMPTHHAEAAETAVRTMPLSALPSGNERVLVLSEEGDFRSTVEQLLGALGYRTVVTGVSGLAIAAQKDGAAAVIVDAQSLSAATVERIDAFMERRGARAVLVGDSPIEWRGPTVSVSKPFTLPDLAAAVRAAIEGA